MYSSSLTLFQTIIEWLLLTPFGLGVVCFLIVTYVVTWWICNRKRILTNIQNAIDWEARP